MAHSAMNRAVHSGLIGPGFGFWPSGFDGMGSNDSPLTVGSIALPCRRTGGLAGSSMGWSALSFLPYLV